MVRTMLLLLTSICATNASGQDPIQWLLQKLEQPFGSSAQQQQDTKPTATPPSQVDLDLAWRCKPFLSTPWRNWLGSIDMKSRPPVLGFRDQTCTLEEQNHLGRLLISQYSLDSLSVNVRIQGAQEFERERSQRDKQDRQSLEKAERARYEQIERVRREQQQAEQLAEERHREALVTEKARKRTVDEAAVKERQRLLKAGSIKIENFVDAWLYFAPLQDIGSIMLSPLLSPDSNIYGGPVVLDAEQDKNLLRVTPGSYISNLVAYQRQREIAYAFLRITNRTPNYASQAMRLNTEICVIGKYVGNLKYRTVLGTEKIAPLIEASHLGASVAGQCYYQPQTITEFGLLSYSVH